MPPFRPSSARSLASTKPRPTYTSDLPDPTRETIQPLFPPTVDPSAALRRRRAPPRPARHRPGHVLQDEKRLHRGRPPGRSALRRGRLKEPVFIRVSGLRAAPMGCLASVHRLAPVLVHSPTTNRVEVRFSPHRGSLSSPDSTSKQVLAPHHARPGRRARTRPRTPEVFFCCST